MSRLVLGFFISTVLLTNPGCAAEKAAKEPIEERVVIEAGDVTLGATLFRPADARGDLPAIVTVHGSAPTDRNGVGFYTNRALQMGFAVLSFDKRGTGESTGAYTPFAVETSAAMMDDLAMDVVYCVRWLARQQGIDEGRIGLFGGSQAGWVMPLAAAKEPLISFIISGEGTPLSAGEENLHGAVSGDGMGWDRESILKADAALENFHGERGFDPAPYLEKLDIPILWFFGLRDDVIPVAPSLERLEAMIGEGKTNNAIHIFPFGDHNFTNVATGERYDLPSVIEPWLVEIGILEARR